MLYNYFTNGEHVLFVFRILIGFSLIVSSIQLLINQKEFQKAGLLNWTILKRKNKYSHFRGKLFDLVYDYKGIVFLNVARIALFPFIVFCYNQVWPLFVLLVICYAIYFRTSLLINAAEQMNNVAITGLCMHQLFEHTGQFYIIYFYSIILLISYFTSGWLKMYETKWQNGYYLKMILKTRNTDNKFYTNIINVMPDTWYPVLGKFVIWWQITTFAMPFMPPVLLYIYLAIALCFHISTGIIMGLNNFIWTFSAYLPGLIYVNAHIL
jgi:hypothetical protein